ncbi:MULTISPECIES: endo-1,4-beta-xylanase [unclassified Paenibacillus]|uniref:endo-1,4-beta-xylanase n=1 Tax=unclassified Paenibacillus TaxID=185978 RepID=UPI002407405A|nr:MULTISPECIES: endo-1,4-beta-xylanase [unclassified Paenibacillus]MDF9843838.1 endo-1,4-beta-xylanase [Paenibacillus sp. PastF-2]MDF9850478.1 endo-1,4-beta-xylanase [Paenibacillus sp. PastM-2]MDF9857017.1 endo-1,4-beta-xylanase [Paenibacillus sp. PastF-1]MDH6482289.1 endo-1,4-beta-xylanase [Paenibacillus sp. PastH-2]MDH6509744.1 endo-1,4-beta-xylanase [Paenibacillus sp. PastM-3]
MSRTFKRIFSTVLAVSLLLPLGWIAPAAQAANAAEVSQAETTVYHETFAGGAGKAGQSGTASLTAVTGMPFDGNADGAALYVSNRANNWDAADFKFSDLGLVNGETYTVTAVVYVDASVILPEGAKAALQTVNSYGNYAEAAYVAGNAVTLTREFIADTSKDQALRINSNEAGKAVPFYIGDVLITGKPASGGGEEPVRDPALQFNTITFEDQTAGGFAGRSGNETLTVTDEVNHTADGSYALKVEGRTSTWHGPVLRVEKYVDKGSEYLISAWVKLIDPASSQLQLSTQVGDGSSANYVALSPKTISTADGWVKFEGSYRYNSVGGEYLTIYVESSNNATASFYIDDISFVPTGTGPVAIQKDLVPLKAAYRDDFLIGNAISAEDLEGVRLELLEMHHNVATAGNAMKPDGLQNVKGDFTFTAADAMVDKVLAEGMQMHGHVLVWHQQSPAWMNTSQDAEGNTVPLSREEALVNLRTHIRTVMEHFGDKVISWDVVNEAMNDNPGNPADWESSLRQAPWKTAIGADYVEQAFLAAREVLDEHPEWNIKLYYNDYNEDNQNKAQAIYNMVKALNDKYALNHPGKKLIDGIGMQAHYNVNTNPENVRLSLEKFISLGVEVSITELDIQAGSNYELSEKLADAQGYLYAQLMSLYKEHAANIARVTFWGMDDNTSWRASSNPLLFDKSLQAKPAYYGVIDPVKYIAGHQPDTTDANVSNAVYGTPVIDGTVDALWTGVPEMQVNRYQLAWQGASGIAKALWDDQNLYVLVQVSDAQLDKASANAWEQDSVEIFVDQNNGKTSFYQDDDGQFRVNFDNESTFNPDRIAAGFASTTKISGTNYTIEVKIPLTSVTPANAKKLGFDVQINDAKDGARQSVAAWNDTTGNGYQDTSVYGVLTLTGKPDAPAVTPTPTPTPTPTATPGPAAIPGGTGSGAATPKPAVSESKDGVVTLRPEVTSTGGGVKAAVSADDLNKALAQASPAADGRKQVIIEVAKQGDAAGYEVQLPSQSLKGQQSFVLLVKTAAAAVEIPGNILSGAAADADLISIHIKQVSKDGLDAKARTIIGAGPVIDLSLTAGGKAIALGSPETPVKVSILYTPAAAQLGNTAALFAGQLGSTGSLTAIPNSRYDAVSKSLVFHIAGAGTYAPAFNPVSFTDIEKLAWAKEGVTALAARGVVQGTAEGSFSPAAPVKRADFITMLVRALELKGTGTAATGFGDVPAGAYYGSELAIAQQLGIITGYADGTVRPDNPISRQEMMVIAARALAAAGKAAASSSGSLNAYPDAAQVAGYAADSVSLLVKAGVVAGKNGLLAPGDTLTRAEAAVIVYRIWGL